MHLEKIISTRHLQELIPLSRSQIWRLEQAGEFPRRIRIGRRRVGWRSSEVAAWLAERAEGSGNKERG